MPIVAVAVSEIVLSVVLAVALGIQLLIIDPQGLVAPIPHLLCVLTALNALAILRRVRAGFAGGFGLGLAALGGVFLLGLAADPLYIAYLFPPAASFIELLNPVINHIIFFAALLLAAVLCLVLGWGIALLSRAGARRVPVRVVLSARSPI